MHCVFFRITGNTSSSSSIQVLSRTVLVRVDGRVTMQSTSIDAVIQQELTTARGSSSGRSSKTIVGGHSRMLRQTVIALLEGRRLSAHENPGEATVYVLEGGIVLTSGDDEWSGQTGDLLVVPEARHALEAQQDSVLLLTVAKKGMA